MLGTVAGPLMNGGINGVATLRIGYLARARCRSFTAWNERTRSEAARGAFREAALLSRGLVGDIVKTVGGGLLKLPAKMLGSIRDTLSGLWQASDEGGAAPAAP